MYKTLTEEAQDTVIKNTCRNLIKHLKNMSGSCFTPLNVKKKTDILKKINIKEYFLIHC